MVLPSFHQWKRIHRVLNQKEKISLIVLIIIFLGSFILFLEHFYVKNSEIQPAHKGTYIEGVIGEPRFINPVYANNDADRDLMELIFSGLMKYNLNGELVPDIAKDYKISDDKKTYNFFLKENIFWHDGKKFNADDIIFTIQTIQDTDYKSLIRANWLGVEIEKISDYEIKFKLRNPYQGFLDRLTLKIIPKHIWENSSPQNFPLSLYNLQAVGTGPYQVKKIKQGKAKKIISLELSRNQKYFGKSPYLSKIIFYFFNNENELRECAHKKNIDGFSISSPRDYSSFEKDFKKYSFSMPRYFAIFLNQNNCEFFEIKDIRMALKMAVDKKEIKEKILFNHATIVDSPLLPQVYGFQSNNTPCEFNPEQAKQLLEKNGFKLNDSGKRVKIINEKPSFEFESEIKFGSKGKEVIELQKCLAQDSELYPEGKISGYFGQKTKDAVIRFQEKYKKDILEPWNFKKGTGIVGETTRKKLNDVYFAENQETIPFKFSLVTVEDQILKQVAELLKEQWGKIGVDVEIEIYSISDLEQKFIKPRSYDSLLFGEVLEMVPDPFPFWHSSQKNDPGLNLSMYENKKADKILEEIRTCSNPETRIKKYQEFQEIISEDCPAIFLYNPNYVYFVSNKIKGIEIGLISKPSKRFLNIENWYLKTKRKLK